MRIIRRDSINGNNSTEHPTDTNSASESPSVSPSASHTSVQTTPSDPLQQILQKLSILESLNKRITEIQTKFDTHLKDMQSSLVTRFDEVKTILNTLLDEVSARMTILEGRLAPLDDLPLLSNHLSAAVETITQPQSEQAISVASMANSAQPILQLHLISPMSGVLKNLSATTRFSMLLNEASSRN